jgi:hypothetical protein
MARLCAPGWRLQAQFPTLPGFTGWAPGTMVNGDTERGATWDCTPMFSERPQRLDCLRADGRARLLYAVASVEGVVGH